MVDEEFLKMVRRIRKFPEERKEKEKEKKVISEEIKEEKEEEVIGEEIVIGDERLIKACPDVRMVVLEPSDDGFKKIGEEARE